MVQTSSPSTTASTSLDESTYLNRVSRIFSLLDVRKLFITRAQVDAAQAVIARAARQPDDVPAGELSRAYQTRDAVLHPDTGRPILAPLRVASIIPANMCLDWLMIRAQSFGFVVPALAQLANQTYNVLHYRANRNASNDAAAEQRRIMFSYGSAVTISVSTCLSLTWLADRIAQPAWQARWLPASWTPGPLPVARSLVPFFAVAAADILNLNIMRADEKRDGVNVWTEDGQLVGRSRIAGHRAVWQCALLRAAAAAPVLMLPPLAIHMLKAKSPWFAAHPRIHHPLMLGLVGLCIQVTVPLVFGLFRQQSKAAVTELEPELWDKRDAHGRKVDFVYFNRGL